MQDMEPAKRRGRSKSFFGSENETAGNMENSTEKSAPNLNGENADETEKNLKDDEVKNKLGGKGAEIDEPSKARKGKKRKASELKSEDENANEETLKAKDDVPTQSETPVVEDGESKVSDVLESKESENKTDKESESELMDDMTMPQKQTLGKGKRARIPNKKYSDILISPLNKNKTAENGSERIESENDSLVEVSLKDEPTVQASPVIKKQKISVDLTDPKFLKPFKYGWKRELVWRATNDVGGKRNGDIYYYTPTGKKMRSMREVAENLKSKELTLENFTFFKDSLGVDDPEKELIRDAKIKSSSTPVSVSKKVATPKIAKIPKSPKLPASPKVPAKTPTKVLSPKIASPKVDSNESADTTNAKSKPTKTIGNFKIKLPLKKDTKKSSKDEEEMQTDTPTKPATSRRSGKWSNYSDQEGMSLHPCSYDCAKQDGTLPTVQCRGCLCLFHDECVGHTDLKKAYTCKNCAKETLKANQPTKILVPPPLKPINYLKSYGALRTTMPKLQRIPRVIENPKQPMAKRPPLSELPKLTPRPSLSMLPEITKKAKLTEASAQNTLESSDAEKSQEKPSPHSSPPQPIPSGESKSIVGSVTSWLPHNSKIVNSIQQCNAVSGDISGPQMVEYLAGRKFLIIPKHNFMSVSPSVAETAIRDSDFNATYSNDAETSMLLDSASLGPDSDPKTNPEHESPSIPVSSQPPDPVEGDQESSETVTAMEVDDNPSPGNNTEQTPNSASKAKKRTLKVANEAKEDLKSQDFLQNLSFGYNTLLYVFQYLKVQDLLRAGCVCTMWRDVASHPLLWRTVRMKNSQVHSFEGLANTLKKHGTRHLDLRKMLLPPSGDDLWLEFSKVIKKVDTLRRIELCRCPAVVVEKLAVSNPHLEVVNAVTIRCEHMNLEPFKAMTNLKELRIKSTSGLNLNADLDSLKELKQLKHLSLTSIRDLDKMNLSVIAELTNLESLDLGECSDFPETFGSDILIKLEKLEKLRLEKGQGNCHTFEILEAVKDMKQLEQLELVNFDIKSGFDKALGGCQNIKKLLIIPTYISQSATTNHMVLGGVLRLQKTLSHFVWGVTLELLRVTELFVDQCEEPKKEKKPVGNGDSIPVLKPVPLLIDRDSTEIPPAHDPPQVEILALPSLQKLLMQNLPSTRVKILKIPFHATWRQSITDSVN